MTTVAVSGGYDPLHVGHIRQFKEAKALGDRLIVILNDEEFLMNKKGYFILSDEERAEILLSIRYVDEVYILHAPNDDMTVCEGLDMVRPNIFAKGGDRNPDVSPIPEEEVCARLGIKIIYGVGGYEKANSSSWMMKRALSKMTQSQTH